MEYLFENIFENGTIRASPTYDSGCNYNFHWTRDAAIVINSLINLYKKDETSKEIKDKCFKIFNNYIRTENQHTLYHLGEPKFNLINTPYIGDWGRPQNDGPSLRGLVMIKLLPILVEKQNILKNIIYNNLLYTITVLEEYCFGLWEEQRGYHLYTRMVQYKFIKMCYDNNIVELEKLTQQLVKRSKELLFHNIAMEENKIYASFNLEGQIQREFDGAFLLGLNHIDYDLDELNMDHDCIKNYVDKLILNFKEEYPIATKMQIPFIGRYSKDLYFGGNPWIITTVALFQYWIKTGEIINHQEELVRFIKFIKEEKKMDLSEQIDKNNGDNISVDRLTWNYAELITLELMMEEFCLNSSLSSENLLFKNIKIFS